MEMAQQNLYIYVLCFHYIGDIRVPMIRNNEENTHLQKHTPHHFHNETIWYEAILNYLYHDSKNKTAEESEKEKGRELPRSKERVTCLFYIFKWAIVKAINIFRVAKV